MLFGQKWSIFKAVDEKGMVVKEFRFTRKISYTLLDNRKDV
jgi:hypothetical protein